MTTFSKGDAVSWNTPQGTTTGTVVAVHTDDVEIKDHTFHGTEDEPMYEVESDSTGAHAAHKADALTREN